MAQNRLKLAILCGGPSLERGISLNSARSLLDHFPEDIFEIFPLYVDPSKQVYSISPSQLYSNTPEDFDFKLNSVSFPVDLACFLKSIDLVFPAIHGPFGEDGELQAILEKHQIPFVGTSSHVLKKIFPKHLANQELQKLQFPVLPYFVLTPESQIPPISERMIIKPSSGGSSIGVFSISKRTEAIQKAEILFRQFEDKHLLLEPFCQGKEFTIVVVESKQLGVLALTPTEIEISYENHQIFDYRKKYLPSHQTFYHTPPRFPLEIIEKIKLQAQDLFRKLGCRDFLRIDGWYMEDGTIYFSDFNPISGLEQNSFLFRQAAHLNFTHEEILLHIVENACARYSIPFPQKQKPPETQKLKVFVLLGGKTAERQVSLMSGTNVWLKLLKSKIFQPVPFLLDMEDRIWELPYSYALHHTVEEIQSLCKTEKTPKNYSLYDFLAKAKQENAFVFIALHGGMGENGEIQKALEEALIPFNGSDSHTSFLCMDKYKTCQKIALANHPHISSLPQKLISLDLEDVSSIWEKTTKEFQTDCLVIKPKDDGCSAGIAILQKKEDLETYIRFVKEKAPFIPPHTFALQNRSIEMSISSTDFLLEPFLQTDLITVENGSLQRTFKTGWIEMTVGVLESQGVYTSLSPSITVAEKGVLSLEEKFQGGTGVNLTPPPESILTAEDTKKVKQWIEETARLLKVRNYARIDIFYHKENSQMLVIEANTLPALTPSTVLYHQALAENPPITPRELLEKIIHSSALKNQV